MTWKCAQIDQHPSIMLVPNYQILKTSLKFLISLRKSTKSRRPDSCNRRLDVLSRWLKTKSQIKFIFSDLMFLYMCQWSSGIIAGNDSDDLGSIPGRVNFLKFQISIPLIFSHVQGYIYTHLDWNYHNHHSLVALCQSIELMVKSSIPVKVRMSWEVLWGY